MVEEIGQYRSAVTDALGRVIPDEGDLRVWLDDELEDRKAPEGWVHLVTAREVCFLLLTGRVVQLSLDHDLSDDIRYGRGDQVIDFLDDQQGQFGVRFGLEMGSHFTQQIARAATRWSWRSRRVLASIFK